MLPNSFFESKYIHKLYSVPKSSQKAGYFCNKNLPKVNNRPIGEYSPNLVTMMAAEQITTQHD
jgi:hypothetical protein